MGDFDFLFGNWDVANHRLVRRLEGSDDWEDFAATAEIRSLFGGAANIDEITFPTLGISGVTLRLFDAATGCWHLHWGVSGSGALFPPVIGEFVDGQGIFYGEDVHEQTPVQVRFRWTHEGTQTARWDQAFSSDGGASWEINWVMTLTRRS